MIRYPDISDPVFDALDNLTNDQEHELLIDLLSELCATEPSLDELRNIVTERLHVDERAAWQAQLGEAAS